MEVPIRDGKIKMADAIKYIAAIVYPEQVNSAKHSRRKAEKAVRERIRRAFKKRVFGRIYYSDDAELDANDFFMWAREQEKWQALYQERLPLHFVLR